jgi:hypothetical protein
MSQIEDQSDRQARIEADIRRLFARYRVARGDTDAESQTGRSSARSVGRFRGSSSTAASSPGTRPGDTEARDFHG